ncbi:hypothetical protein [Alteribacillus iranensis]|uniref:Uncharacterized protein n=1 Tax=Alteribacillus iranensis TaxID=930128 RepID=A0A1I2CRM9_9BACI|nr:hypothetical protein [Alteribacillus iranensis]SFE70423.1 hypothetical protein SAMN05192532_103136 [Alteribacillus iranensis]
MSIIWMIAGAAIVYFLMSRLPWKINNKMRLQFMISAFLIVLLGFLLMNLYSWLPGLLTMAGLLVFFSIIFGKQLEYEETNDEYEEEGRPADSRPEPQDSKSIDIHRPIEKEKFTESEKEIPSTVESDPMPDLQKQLTEEPVPERNEEEDFFFDMERRALIDEEEETVSEEEEGLSLRVNTQESQKDNENEETLADETRTRLLRELEEEYEREEGSWRR